MLDKNDYIILNKIINEYEFINNDGRLDLEYFCVILSTCMMHDQTGLSNQRPDYFHQLLIDLIEQRSPDMLHRWVQQQKLIDWTPKDANLYPVGYRTYIHISALIMHGDTWISLIGSHILEIPHSESRSEYFGWVNENWHLTYSFITAYHDAVWKKAKQIDVDSWNLESESASNFEALRLSKKENIDYETAINKLLVRNKAWTASVQRIKRSIDSEFYLEAISITENAISNILYNWISDKKTIRDDSSFNSLIKESLRESKNDRTDSLLKNIDNWRSQRNDAIHNFVTSSIKDFHADENNFQRLSKDTAQKGLEIIEQIFEWYRMEAVNFLEHRFHRNTIHS